MRIKWIKVGTSSIIFLIMLIVAFILVKPIYTNTTKSLIKLRTSILLQVQEKTGLAIKYEKASPSLISGLKLSNISVIDAEQNEVVIRATSVKLSYNLFSLLFSGLDKGLGDLVIQGLSAEYNTLKNKNVFDKIVNLFSSDDNTKKDSSTMINIPFGIKITNSSLAYIQSDFKITTKLKNIRFKSADDLSFIIADIKGSVNFNPTTEKFEKIGFLKTNFELFTSFSTSLDELAAQLRLVNFDGKGFSIQPLQFILNYTNKLFQIQILQNDAPVQIRAEYNTENKNAFAFLRMNNFNPFSLIRLKDKNSMLATFKNSKLFGEYQVSYDGNTNKIAYSVDGSVSLGQKKSETPIAVEYNFSGDNSLLEVPLFTINSDFIKASFDGSCNLQTIQPQGNLLLDYYLLPNGNKISGEMYIDHLDKGFMCFIPQLFLGEQVFTALELDVIPEKESVDYSFSVSDYSHQNDKIIGLLKADGSLLLDSDTFLQCNLSMDSIYIASIVKVISYFSEIETANTLLAMSNSVSNYVMTTECFLSTNFKSLSYNVPYSVIVNTKKDNEMALFSFDGNENTMQVSQFDVLFAGQQINLNLQADYSNGFDNLYVNTDFELNSVPYNFVTTIINGKRISVIGDYGLDCEITTTKGITGTVNMDVLPVSVNSLFFALSIDTEFYFNSTVDWKADINRFDFLDNSGKHQIPPHLTFSGSLNTYGALFDKLTYADSASILSGKGEMMWAIENDLLSNASLLISLSNSVSDEKIDIQCNASNPANKSFSNINFLNDIYISAQANIINFPTARILTNQKTPNMINADISVLGSISNPGITANVYNSSIALGGSPVNLSLLANLEDKIFTISNSNIKYVGQEIKDFELNFNLSTYEATSKGLLVGNLFEETIQTPFSINAQAEKKEKSVIPEIININTIFEDITSTKYGNYGKTQLSLLVSPNRIDIIGGLKNSLVGTVLNGQDLKVSLSKNLPFNLTANGVFKNGLIDLQVDDINIDFEKCSSLINFWFFQALAGNATGNLAITGYMSDPDFSGAINCKNLKFTSPGFIKEPFTVKDITFTANENIISANNFVCKTKKGYVDAFLQFEFDQWSLYSVDLNIKTRKDNLVAAKFSMTNMEFEGDAACDLKINTILSEGVEVTGSVFAENAAGTLTLFSKQSDSTSSNNYFSTKLDLSVLIGQHGQVQFPNKENPILRALINPQTNISVKMDTDNNFFELNGDLVLRGGEVVALGRTFYLREGRLLLKETQDSFDPTITVRAEMRETDSDGNNVRIILSANNQKLSMFTPSFSASPAKSESEIMALLGQIVISEDTETLQDLGVNVLAGSLNYVAQSTAIKQMENGLRDFFKFDIFSLHTSIIENALLVGIDDTSKTVTIGNYLDDSSVYIGKYLGNALYIDALMHLDYNASLVESGKSTTGLSLEPEFGFELDSPFAVIRWSIAPDIGSLNKFLVPDASIGLSWKLVF